MMANQKYRSVIYLKKLDDGKVALLPFAVKSACGRTFTGNYCNRCIIVNKKIWEENGLNILMTLLLQAPHKEDDSFSQWDTEEKSNIFHSNYSTQEKNCLKVETWIDKPLEGEIKHGVIKIYPSWTPYRAHEIFQFKKLPIQSFFLEKFLWLMDKSNSQD